MPAWRRDGSWSACGPSFTCIRRPTFRTLAPIVTGMNGDSENCAPASTALVDPITPVFSLHGPVQSSRNCTSL
jgi:hypothetical protein